MDIAILPALRLYERLGFQMIEHRGVYLLLEWTQGSRALQCVFSG